MQLTAMPSQRCDAEQLRIIRGLVALHRRIGQHPGIHTMRFPDLCHLLAGFLETQLIAECLGLVALFRLNGGKLAQFAIEPLLADFQRGKAAVPPSLPFGTGLDVLDYKDAHREEVAEEVGQPQFPMPACPGGWRQFLFGAFAVWAWLAARSGTPSARAAQLATLLHAVFYARSGVGLDIEVGMSHRAGTVALLLGSRIDPHGDRLHLASRGFTVEPDAEDAAPPERRGLPAFDPPSRPLRGRRHQWLLMLVYHRYKHVR